MTSMMNRRAFVTGLGAVLAAPRGAEAQRAGKVPRIGWLGGPTRESAEPFVEEFQRGLKNFGRVEGQNVVIEWRFAGGRAAGPPDLAAELVHLGVDLIVVPSTPTALAAKNASKTIPIVTVGVGDPVGLGLASRRASSLVSAHIA
jgi:putative tryptophan/tyrosine transport system substrate-binding protein